MSVDKHFVGLRLKNQQISLFCKMILLVPPTEIPLVLSLMTNVTYHMICGHNKYSNLIKPQCNLCLVPAFVFTETF